MADASEPSAHQLETDDAPLARLRRAASAALASLGLSRRSEVSGKGRVTGDFDGGLQAAGPAPGLSSKDGDEPYDWDARNAAVLSLLYTLAIEEVKEVARMFDSLKTRAAVVFSAVSASIAFLVGSALSNLERSSYNRGLLTTGIVGYAIFGVATAFTLFPASRAVFLPARVSRDEYVRGKGPQKASFAFSPAEVQWALISTGDAIVKDSTTHLRRLRRGFILMVMSAALSITSWSLLVAYAKPVP